MIHQFKSNHYYDTKNRVTKTGAGSSGDIMRTLNYYNDTTGMMTKVRYTDAASATSDVQYYFNKARQMTKLTDWTGHLEYRSPPSARSKSFWRGIPRQSFLKSQSVFR